MQSFSGGLQAIRADRGTCESELKRAVARGELELHYQPQLRLGDRRIVGAEALLRWNSPERGRFCREHSSMSWSAARWPCRSGNGSAPSLRIRGLDRRGGRPDFKFAVNVFGAQFAAAIS